MERDRKYSKGFGTGLIVGTALVAVINYFAKPRIHVGDLNNDGLIDITATNYLGRVESYISQPDGSYKELNDLDTSLRKSLEEKVKQLTR